MSTKFVYSFDEGNKDMRGLLGGKGANLAEMTNIGLPVPQGFTITTEACNDYYENDLKIRQEVIDQVEDKLAQLEREQGKKLGSDNNPLLVSVRSGAVFSMPGMMDTILNLGLNDTSVKGLIDSTKNERFSYDSYRRFIQMFSDVAMEVPKYKFENVLDKMKEAKGYSSDLDLTTDDLKVIVEEFKKIYKDEIGEDFPQDPKKQLMLAIEAVFRSWNNPRAIVYRKLNDIPGNLGTAVNIQSMVFGNMGMSSGTGVAFTRNPSTGENRLFGEYLINAQGEDVVAGIRTPQSIDTLKEEMPEMYDQFVNITQKLEAHYKDMQDIEFTIENGKLYILQTRNGKRTAKAAINVVVDLVNAGTIDKEEAIMRIEPNQLDQLLHPTFDPKALKSAELLAKGLPASPGAATGKVYFHADDAVLHAKEGEKVLLVRQETSPEDIEGMVSAEGILTARGGMTSHAAVVARGMGKCCVAGCGELRVDEAAREIRCGDRIIKEGQYLSIDGSSGCVYLGSVEMTSVELVGNFEVFMNWVDEIRDMMVRTNADNPRDAKKAIEFGAEGIGLCRTEHMFFEEDRIPAVREMIIAENVEDRVKALDKLLPFQREDFHGIFKAMDGKPCNIRLLDPPLHEFLPHDDASIEELAKQMGIRPSDLKKRVVDLDEFNPMLGHRGCRLAVTYPEICIMQARAIAQGAVLATKDGHKVTPEIMVPLVGHVNELKMLRPLIEEAVNEEFEKAGVKVDYTVGTMIEIPRACVTADEIAEVADFFSFGTNDLTQMGFGYSRDDAGKFLGEYVDKGILEKDPFQVLEQKGIGRLVQMAAELGRGVKPNLKLGICGEHGGEPSSVEFCYNTGLNYVSCSPFRVPIARLAAAQATVKKRKGDSHRDK
ncbi:MULTISPECIES: pyruvate, phosphate dikinase [Peptostreptococcus]|uniref:Pyruvate, phosphate dikinase n=2 Tax=Peptostreptococcus anaerobius TaxID=1261 RepID=D3MU16_9FIRM|nr:MULTISPECIES: pyruvate, phosphate dikinase [Peptostreptococcus]EFD04326.1 pyruvate, phosphate dikinase [Peptostreptococcus anaerobius 653-L]KXB72502.1 pyruvate, phosphate dikinase [Peptostreptococcus anaerobius]KXI10494.1 pyruvate, phosphate dikinase [Peptostreptococcus anaerobius]MDB8821340.1 pyruvate, phosphate dikinase [Peptostreptococcus anaerobius]MDB8826014.1 pyruvate, phosphate dikinase [Peptostreptococcus anaerobius]